LLRTRGSGLGSWYWLLGAAHSQITVRIADSNKDETGLADVLLKSLGLTGVMVIIAIVAGVLMAAILFFWRSRKPLDH
jgi:subtilase family serine protease